MALSFLIPLFTGLITGYIFKKCADEIAYLAGLFAIVSLILSLVLAPWQVQLLLLIVVLIATKKLLLQNEYKLKVLEHNQEKLNSADKNELVISQPKSADKKILAKYPGASYQASDFINEISEKENPDKKRSLPQRSYQQAKTPELKFRVDNTTSKENPASVDTNFAQSKSSNNNSIHHGDRIFLGRFFS